MFVAPLVGAWIETPPNKIPALATPVAPLVGAWIETSAHCSIIVQSKVAPLVGAWIETQESEQTSDKRERSHLS